MTAVYAALAGALGKGVFDWSGYLCRLVVSVVICVDW